MPCAPSLTAIHTAASSAGSLTDHVVEAGAASLLVTVLMYRRVEERWSLAEVRARLRT